MTPVPPGCTVSAPMLMEASDRSAKSRHVSVSGVKTMEEGVETAALFATHTPPPVVPT